jgi:hypothetical protein
MISVILGILFKTKVNFGGVRNLWQEEKILIENTKWRW